MAPDVRGAPPKPLPQPCSPASSDLLLQPAVRAALPAAKHGFRWHDLRHSCASLSLAGTEPACREGAPWSRGYPHDDQPLRPPAPRWTKRSLDCSPFTGEGHRKVWARLWRRGVRTSRKRVLRLTREAELLAPTPEVRKRAVRLNEGTITVSVPDTLWATDATEGRSDEGRSSTTRAASRCLPADGPLRRRGPPA